MFLAELLSILEGKEPYGSRVTPGLNLGNFKLDDQKKMIMVTIGNKKYGYTPSGGKSVFELFNSVTGMAKHSPGRALVYLKKHATGEISEEIDLEESELLERASPRNFYKNQASFEEALPFDASVTSLKNVALYRTKGKYVGAWDKSRKIGVIDLGFTGSGVDLIDVLQTKNPRSIKESEELSERVEPTKDFDIEDFEKEYDVKFSRKETDDGVEYSLKADPDDFHYFKMLLVKMGFKKTPWGYRYNDRWTFKDDRNTIRIFDENLSE